MLELTLPQTTMINKIAWLNDFKIFGGSEETQNRLLEISPYKTYFLTSKEFNTNYDLYILNNFRTFTKEQIDFICENKFIAYWHDVLFEDGKQIKKIKDNALANIFLSPLHKDVFEVKYGLVGDNTHIIPPIFSPKQPTTKKGREGVCYYGSIWPHKGIDNLLLWARNNKTVIDFYGDGNSILVEQLKQSKYANYMGFADRSVLTNYQYFIHLPDEIEAFGRSCFEAYLAGCHILHNNKIGAFTFDWDYDDRGNTLDTCIKKGNCFWDTIQNIIDN